MLNITDEILKEKQLEVSKSLISSKRHNACFLFLDKNEKFCSIYTDYDFDDYNIEQVVHYNGQPLFFEDDIMASLFAAQVFSINYLDKDIKMLARVGNIKKYLK